MIYHSPKPASSSSTTPDLETFIDHLGGPAQIPDNLTIFTEDEHTRGTIEFNAITITDDEYGIATQLHHPIQSDDTVIDLRRDEPHSQFADFVLV